MSLAMSHGVGGGGIALPSALPPSMPHTFQGNAGPSGPAIEAPSGPSGAGGAYSIRDSMASREPAEDTHACLGMDIGTDSYSAVIYMDGEIKPLTGSTPANSTFWVDGKGGVRSMRKWLGRAERYKALPKKVHLGSSGGGSGSSVRGAMRMLGVGQREDKLSLVRLQAEGPGARVKLMDDKKSAEADDTSGVVVELLNPDAAEDKDKQLDCNPEHFIAILLASLKLKAAKDYGVNCVTCNVTVPPMFSNLSRIALQRAVFTAGMTPARFVSAPLAAAVGSLWKPEGGGMPSPGSVIAVVDVGASSASVQLVQGAEAEGGSGLEVLGSEGNNYCGGADMDHCLAQALCRKWKADHISSSAAEDELLPLLLKAATSAREALSNQDQVEVSLPAGSFSSDPAHSWSTQVSQKELVAAVGDVLKGLADGLQRAAAKATQNKHRIEKVLLCGGCTAMPAVKDCVTLAFGTAKVQEAPSGCKALGAALLLAAHRGLLEGPSHIAAQDRTALPVLLSENSAPRATGKRKGGSADRTKGAVTSELFLVGTEYPCTKDRTFYRTAPSQSLRISALQPVDSTDGSATHTVYDGGNILLQYNSQDVPAIADSVVVEFGLDSCGIVTAVVTSSDVPLAADNSRMSAILNRVGAAVVVLCVVLLGYLKLQDMVEAPAREKALSRIRLTRFYELHAPEKLPTVEQTIEKYEGRYSLLFTRLEGKYGEAIPSASRYEL